METTKSLWSLSCDIHTRESLKENITTDTAVIGGGMCGILTAYMLSKRGINTVVLEADRIASGVTRNTTAKITTQHYLCYDKLINNVGKEKAFQYAHASKRAIEDYRKIIKELQIDCDFEDMPALAYSLTETDTLEAEMRAALSLGIDADMVTSSALPFKIKGAVRFKGQAQFHPLKFIKAVAEKLQIYEQTKALSVENNVILTNGGKVSAKHIVVATHYPFINAPGFYFMRTHQERSYALAIKNVPALDGMYIDASSGGYSFRSYGDTLIFGGEGHRTGKNPQGGAYAKLRAKAKELYPNAQEVCAWSAQDCVTLDSIPYIGNYSASTPNSYVATGFHKWGMTGSMVAARIISDAIIGEENSCAEVFSPQRFNITASMKSLMTDFAQSVAGLSAGAFSMPKEQLESVEIGHGGIVEFVGNKVGVYRKGENEVYAVSVKCPHLGCELAWNPDELSWDCPCHGSRFTYKGELISGPAMKGLLEKDDKHKNSGKL